MQRLIGIILCILVFPLAQAKDQDVEVAPDRQKAILVTGASSGIGKKIALTLADNGFYVYAGARKAGDIATLSALSNIEGIRLDVTIQDDIDAAVSKIGRSDRGLYGLVNNAGVFLFDPLIETSEQDLRFIFDVNVLGPYRITKAFAPLIMEQKGRITNIGSIAGIASSRLFGPYSMSKHAMEAFSESLAQEMAKFDVQVSIIEPGNFRSDIMKNMRRRLQQLHDGKRHSLYEEEIANFANFAKADRSHHADPKPVAEAILHFLTAEKPHFRYMVTPNQSEASFAVRRSLQKAIQLNQHQPYSHSRNELVDILDQALTDASQ